MKPLHLVPPALALLAAGIWLGLQHQSLSNVEGRNTTLRERIEAAKHAGPGDEEKGGGAGGKNGKQGGPKKIDWKDMAMRQRNMNRGENPTDMRAMIEMQRALLSMSAEELIAQLDEIEALDIPEDARASLQGVLVGMLAEKDPKLALDRFGDKLDDERSGMSWQIANAFQQWSKKDPAAAMAWLDARIAAGKLESKSLNGMNDVRQRLESAAITSLIGTDVAAAGERLSRIPEGQRAAIFQNGMLFNLKPGSEKAVADLIRSQVPKDEQTFTLAQSASMLIHQGGYERVGKFLGQIEANSSEREAIVAQAVQSKVMNERDSSKWEGAIADARTWALEQSPDAANRITGQALAQSPNFSQAAELALKYQQESGSDEVLVSFLQGGAYRQNPEAALKLLDKISDPAKREELRKTFQGQPTSTFPGVPSGGPAVVAPEEE